MDVLIFDDEAKASLMTQYTGDQGIQSRAILLMIYKVVAVWNCGSSWIEFRAR
jgi:hypothetical protein